MAPMPGRANCAHQALRTALGLAVALTALAACGPEDLVEDPPPTADATCRAMPEAGAIAVPASTTTYPSVIMAFRVRFAGEEECVAGDGMVGASDPQGGQLEVPAAGQPPPTLQIDVGTRAQGLSVTVSGRDLVTAGTGPRIGLYVDDVFYQSSGTQCRTRIVALDPDRVAGTFTCTELAASPAEGTFPEATTAPEPRVGPMILEAEGWFEATK